MFLFQEIYVSVDFSYEDDLVNGTIRKVVRGAEAGLDKNHEPFQVLIQIYGFNETPHNVEPRYILNRGQQFYDMARAPDARDSGKPQETLSLMNEDIEILENFGEEDDNDNGLDGHPDYHYEEYNDEQLLNSNMNKIIQMGRRQEGIPG